MASNEPKFTKDGLPDGRGHAEGSKATQFAINDGRKRPGRPKKSHDHKTIVERVREMPVQASAKGKAKRTVNSQEGILIAQRQKALSGDTRAAQFMQAQFDRYDVPTTDPNLTASLLEQDRDIIDAARNRGVLPALDEDQKDE